MASTGIKTTNLQSATNADSVLVNDGSGTKQLSIARLSALLTGYTGPSKETLAELAADLTWAEGKVGFVWGDPDGALRGTYLKSGAADAGSWSRIGDLPTSTAALQEIASLREEFQAYFDDIDLAGSGFAGTQPGVSPGAFTSDLDADPKSCTLIDDVAGITFPIGTFNGSPLGRVATVTNIAAVIARRDTVQLRPGQIWKMTALVYRTDNPDDPNGGTVEFGVNPMAGDYTASSEAPYIGESIVLRMAHGLHYVQFTFGYADELLNPDIEIAASVPLVRPFIRLYGADHTTSIVLLDARDITDVRQVAGADDVDLLATMASAANANAIVSKLARDEAVPASERAVNAAVLAEAARDSTFTNAKAATTIAGARALVADGEPFVVVGELMSDAYLRTAGGQDYLTSYPTALYVGQKADKATTPAVDQDAGYAGAGGNSVLQITDEDGNAVLSSTEKEFQTQTFFVGATGETYPGVGGSLVVMDKDGNPVLSISNRAFATDTFFAGPASAAYAGTDDGFALVDQNGNAVLSYDGASIALPNMKVSATEIIHPEIDALREEIADVTAANLPLSYVATDGRAAEFSTAPVAEYVHIMVTGQSLSVDAGHTGEVIHSDPLDFAFMFNGGLNWPYQNPYLDSNTAGYIASSHTSLVAMQEGVGESTGETPSAGMALMMQQLATADGCAFGSDSGQYLVVSNPGVGGSSVEELLASPRFDFPTADVEYAASLSVAAGKSSMTFAMPIIQGESNTYSDAATWKANWQTYKANIEALMVTEYGGDQDLFTPIYQMAREIEEAPEDIMLAQLELSKLDGWGLATPDYWLEKVSDGLHLTALSSVWIGAHFGRCIYEAKYKGFRRRPLDPVSQRRFGNSLALQFPVVDGRRLQWNTTQVPQADNYGFELMQSNGTTPITITGVKIVGRDTVVITGNAPIPAGAFVRYGFRGDGTDGQTNRRAFGFGNLQDDDPLVFDPEGLALPMNNWAPIFQQEIL